MDEVTVTARRDYVYYLVAGCVLVLYLLRK